MTVIKEERFKVIVKPNSKKNDILGFDINKKAYKIAVKEPADKNKANKELVRFLSKEIGKKVYIIKGLKNKEKIIEVE